MFFVFRGFNTLWRKTVHNPDDAATLLGNGDQYLQRIGCCAIYPAYLVAVLYLVEHIDRIGFLQQNTEDVTCTYILKNLDAALNEAVVIALAPDKAGT